MPKQFTVSVLAILAFAFVGCGGRASDAGDARPGGASADDLALLIRLGALARERVHQQVPDAVLEQVDIAPSEGRYEFRFVDAGAARAVVASGDVGARTPDAFTLTVAEVSPPGTSGPIELAALRVGPDGAVAAAVRELSAASPRSLVLTRQDGRLMWRIMVNGPKGIVSGTVPDETGRFVHDTSTP